MKPNTIDRLVASLLRDVHHYSKSHEGSPWWIMRERIRERRHKTRRRRRGDHPSRCKRCYVPRGGGW